VADQRPLFDEPASQPASGRRGKRPVSEAMPVPTGITRKALEALRAAVVGHDHVDLGATRLARDVYDEAAAVLETIGAKWHTGRKRHLFTESWDPGMFADVIETGEAPPANPLAYFATPRAVADDMLRQRQIEAALHCFGRLVVIEPSAGTGVMAVATAHAWARWATDPDLDKLFSVVCADQPTLHLVLVELDARRARILGSRVKAEIEAILPGQITVEVLVGDFLELAADQLGNPRVVMMNPPFSLPGDRRAWWTHLQWALKVVHQTRGAVGCIMPPAFRYSVNDGMAEALELISRGTAWPLPVGTFKSAGTEIGTWALTIAAEEAGEPEIDIAAMVIESTHWMMNELERAYQAAKTWGVPDHTDRKSSWRKEVYRLTRSVALGEDDQNKRPHDKQRGGDPVSFGEEYQRKLSRALWAGFADG
jgi:predicted RNA methylase